MARPSPIGSSFPTNTRGFSVTHPSPASLWNIHWAIDHSLVFFPWRNVPETVNIALPPGFIGSSGRLVESPDFTLYRASLFSTEYVAQLFEELPLFSSLETNFSTDASSVDFRPSLVYATPRVLRLFIRRTSPSTWVTFWQFSSAGEPFELFLVDLLVIH